MTKQSKRDILEKLVKDCEEIFGGDYEAQKRRFISQALSELEKVEKDWLAKKVEGFEEEIRKSKLSKNAFDVMLHKEWDVAVKELATAISKLYEK